MSKHINCLDGIPATAPLGGAVEYSLRVLPQHRKGEHISSVHEACIEMLREAYGKAIKHLAKPAVCSLPNSSGLDFPAARTAILLKGRPPALEEIMACVCVVGVRDRLLVLYYAIKRTAQQRLRDLQKILLLGTAKLAREHRNQQYILAVVHRGEEDTFKFVGFARLSNKHKELETFQAKYPELSRVLQDASKFCTQGANIWILQTEGIQAALDLAMRPQQSSVKCTTAPVGTGSAAAAAASAGGPAAGGDPRAGCMPSTTEHKPQAAQVAGRPPAKVRRGASHGSLAGAAGHVAATAGEAGPSVPTWVRFQGGVGHPSSAGVLHQQAADLNADVQDAACRDMGVRTSQQPPASGRLPSTFQQQQRGTSDLGEQQRPGSLGPGSRGGGRSDIACATGRSGAGAGIVAKGNKRKRSSDGRQGRDLVGADDDTLRDDAGRSSASTSSSSDSRDGNDGGTMNNSKDPGVDSVARTSTSRGDEDKGMTSCGVRSGGGGGGGGGGGSRLVGSGGCDSGSRAADAAFRQKEPRQPKQPQKGARDVAVAPPRLQWPPSDPVAAAVTAEAVDAAHLPLPAGSHGPRSRVPPDGRPPRPREEGRGNAGGLATHTSAVALGDGDGDAGGGSRACEKAPRPLRSPRSEEAASEAMALSPSPQHGDQDGDEVVGALAQGAEHSAEDQIPGLDREVCEGAPARLSEWGPGGCTEPLGKGGRAREEGNRTVQELGASEAGPHQLQRHQLQSGRQQVLEPPERQQQAQQPQLQQQDHEQPPPDAADFRALTSTTTLPCRFVNSSRGGSKARAEAAGAAAAGNQALPRKRARFAPDTADPGEAANSTGGRAEYAGTRAIGRRLSGSQGQEGQLHPESQPRVPRGSYPVVKSIEQPSLRLWLRQHHRLYLDTGPGTVGLRQATSKHFLGLAAGSAGPSTSRPSSTLQQQLVDKVAEGFFQMAHWIDTADEGRVLQLLKMIHSCTRDAPGGLPQQEIQPYPQLQQTGAQVQHPAEVSPDAGAGMGLIQGCFPWRDSGRASRQIPERPQHMGEDPVLHASPGAGGGSCHSAAVDALDASRQDGHKRPRVTSANDAARLAGDIGAMAHSHDAAGLLGGGSGGPPGPRDSPCRADLPVLARGPPDGDSGPLPHVSARAAAVAVSLPTALAIMAEASPRPAEGAGDVASGSSVAAAPGVPDSGRPGGPPSDGGIRIGGACDTWGGGGPISGHQRKKLLQQLANTKFPCGSVLEQVRDERFTVQCA